MTKRRVLYLQPILEPQSQWLIAWRLVKWGGDGGGFSGFFPCSFFFFFLFVCSLNTARRLEGNQGD
jgi:hypothetical protein